MKSKMLLNTICFVFAVFAVLVNSSCKKEEAEKEEEVIVEDPKPTIPPASTFSMDFSSFSNASDTTKKTKGVDTVYQYNYWGTAAFKVGVWNFLVTAYMAIPVIAFRESFNHQPTWDKTAKQWVWTYTYTNAADSYDAKLTGKVSGNQVNWSMYVTKTAGANLFTDFLWYTGTSYTDNTSGAWTLNDKANSQPCLQIDWTRKSDSIADIKYTNVVPNGKENGGYISFAMNTDKPYNAYYTIFNKGLNSLVNIEWNRTFKDGRIRDEAVFKDLNWHKWNTKLQNTLN